MRWSIVVRVAPWCLLAASFAFVAACYGRMGAELPVFRTWGGRAVVVAPKSFLTAFRVPMIGLVMGAAVWVMRRRTRDLPDPKARHFQRVLWRTLLAAVAAKTFFESLEFVAITAETRLRGFAPWFRTGNGAAVVIGIAFAAATWYRGGMTFRDSDWRLSRRDRRRLSWLLVAYVVIVMAPVLGSRWVR